MTPPAQSRTAPQRFQSRIAGRAASDDLPRDLAPVAAAMWDSARTRATALLASADHDAGATLARARLEASQILERARAEGEAAADRAAALRLAGARREARQLVLAARMTAYETLRRRSVAGLVERSSGPGGEKVAELLGRVTRGRSGDTARSETAGAVWSAAVAESVRRRPTLDPEDLVDRALDALSGEVESLWS